MANAEAKKMTAINKAAILLMTLGPHEASSIMKHLNPKQVQQVGVEMAKLANVERHEVEEVIDSFLTDAQEQTGLGVDSDEYIKNVLIGALGEDRAAGIIDRILMGANAKGLDTLKWMDPRSIAELIRYEHPQIQAIVLSYLEPDQAASVIQLFDENVRLDLAMRIGTLETVQPKALQELYDIMDAQFSGGASSQTTEVGGLKTAADIMNFLDSTIEAQLMDSIKEKDQELGQNIQDLMFVFDNLMDLDDRDVQGLLREINTDTLLLALKGADPMTKEKIFTNMSKRAAALLKDDLEAKGPVKLSDVEGAQKDILAIARRLADAGEISLGGAGGEEMI